VRSNKYSEAACR